MMPTSRPQPYLKHRPLASTMDPNGTEYCEKLPQIISEFRNSFAHGDTILLGLPTSLMALQVTSAIIHQIYECSNAGAGT